MSEKRFDSGEGIEEEMARLATLTLRVQTFLGYTSSTYAFFIYAMGILSFVFMALSITSILGVEGDLIITISAFVGVAVSTILLKTVLYKIMASARIAKEETQVNKHGILILTLMIVVIAVISYVVSTYMPESSPVLWHPAVALFLLALYLMTRLPYTKPHLIASVIMLASDPLVIAYPESHLDIGTMILAYFIGGLYGIWKGLEELGGR